MLTRRQFLSRTPGGVMAGLGALGWIDPVRLWGESQFSHRADVLIVGGGLGGCSAALAALQRGLKVTLTEPTDWIGGQLTSQGVPPDEHRWIETHGANASYRRFRSQIRDYYRRNYPLTPEARAKPNLNPGNGSVSRLCHEPRVALAVLMEAMLPYLGGGQLKLLLEHVPESAEVDGDEVRSVQLRSLTTGNVRSVEAKFVVDATEMGDLLPLTKTEYVLGNEGKSVTGELHAPERPDPMNQQAFTCCFALEHRPSENHTISKPENYGFWREYAPVLKPAWPGKWLDFTYTHPRSGQPKKLGFNPELGPHGGVVNLWTYRRIADRKQFLAGRYASDLCLVNWPQNDYVDGPLVDVDDRTQQFHLARAKDMNRSLIYWLQTEAPRFDGGTGFPGLRLRADVMGSEDGMAKYPYVRESRRIRALVTVTEAHCGREQRAMETGQTGDALTAKSYDDSVGVGSYPIDLHPSTGGDNYIDFESLPFELPLGALIPQRVKNLLPASKNIGTTHVTNGCYRLHPVEWGIGEAVGHLVGYCTRENVSPRQVWETQSRREEFQQEIVRQGVEIRWPA